MKKKVTATFLVDISEWQDEHQNNTSVKEVAVGYIDGSLAIGIMPEHISELSVEVQDA